MTLRVFEERRPNHVVVLLFERLHLSGQVLELVMASLLAVINFIVESVRDKAERAKERKKRERKEELESRNRRRNPADLLGPSKTLDIRLPKQDRRTQNNSHLDVLLVQSNCDRRSRLYIERARPRESGIDTVQLRPHQDRSTLMSWQSHANQQIEIASMTQRKQSRA